MKNNNQHTDRIIKRKIKKYEFEFSDHAWDKMEAMMDSPPPSSRSNHFFNLRNLLLMILLLVILTISVFGTFTPGETANTTQLSAFPLTALSNDQVLATTENTITSEILFSTQKDSSRANQQNFTKAINPLKIFPKGNTPFSLTPFIPVNQPNRDSTLQQRMTRKLAQFNEHYAPEKVYLHLDRTFFKPGEDIWFSAYLRDANTLKASSKSDILHVELLTPSGGVLKKLALVSKNGQAMGDFTLPANAAGGMYKIKAYTNWQKNTGESFERDLQVQKTVLPNLRMTAEFTRKAYGPGDHVETDLELKTLENTVLANFPYTAFVTIDGQTLPEINGKTLANGKSKLQFDLPKNLSSNDGLINVMIHYNGQVESISRSIPIVLNKIDLQLLPEGGDIIAGIPAQVAFKAINEFGKPADIEGKVYNHNGNEVADFRSYHMGMGAFEITAAADEDYYAKITKPKGITTKYPLPFALKRGYALKVGQQKGNQLQLTVNTTEAESLTAVLQSHGEIYQVKTTPAEKGTHHLTLPVKDLPVGIAAITLFDSKEIPRAERLVFLNPDKKLDITIKTDKEQYLPREKVKMAIDVKDERGMPMPGKFSLVVADDNLLTFADDKQGGIMAYMLLESELKGKIEEPNFYFKAKDKLQTDGGQAPEKDQLLALDYLMLTQGWRRLDWTQMEEQPLAAMSHKSERAVIAGKVFNYQNKPLADVDVEIPGTLFKTKTDESGDFLLSGVELENGPVMLSCKYLDVQRNLSIQNYTSELKMIMPFTAQPTFELAKVTTQDGSFIKGQVVDSHDKEYLIGANIYLKESQQGTVSDLDGKFEIKNVKPGKYTLITEYMGYKRFVQPVEVKKNESLIAAVGIAPDAASLNEIVVTAYTVPLIEQDNTLRGSTIPPGLVGKMEPSQEKLISALSGKVAGVQIRKSDDIIVGQTLTSEQIQKLPIRDVDALAATAAGLSQDDEGDAVSIRGSRAERTDYYIDGIRVQGSNKMVPSTKIKEAQNLLGGTPAAKEEKRAFNFQHDLNPDVAFDIVNEFEEDTDDRVTFEDAIEEEPAFKDLKKRLGYTVTSINNQSRYHTARSFYSPKYNSEESVKVRNDFRSTVYWNPEVTVGRNGKAQVEFFTTDALTTFRTTIEGLTSDGGIGTQTAFFHSQQPISMKVKIPSMLLTGDEVTIPLTLSNNTRKSIDGFLEIFVPEGLKRIDQQDLHQQLVANKTRTLYLKYKAEKEIQSGQIAIAFQSQDGFQDAFAQPVKVLSRGFPVREVYSANTIDKTFKFNITNPIEGTLNAKFATYPSVLNDLVSGLDRMLRQPGGCFEQTSSSNYPNLLVMDYLKSTGTINKEIEDRAMQFMEHGYKRLLTFEVEGGGFDWYGRPPAHESLTAYGLMEFKDMAEVYNVDPDLIDRTAKWLLSRKDGNGGWQKGKPDGHRWETQNPVADAYTTWALAEAGYGKEVKTEIDKSYQDAMETKDPYLMALVANTLFKSNDGRAQALMQMLLKLQDEDGSWNGLSFSMTHSTGLSLKVETTALTTLALLKYDKSNPGLKKAINFIASSKNQYGFGSTQSTVLALKALVEYAKNFKSTEEGGLIAVRINGKKAINKAYAQGEQLSFEDLAPYFKTGENLVEVELKNTKEGMPYDLSIDYSTFQPVNHEACKVTITTELKKTKAGMGNTVRLSTILENTSDETVLNPIAKVGIPAGLSAQPWQLKEMQEKGVFDFYELTEGYAIFYFRGMLANASKTIDLDLKADVPGSYEAPASQAYLYYTNEYQSWSKPERLVISE